MAVDDEPDALKGLSRSFNAQLPHVRLLTAASGAAALDLLREHHVDLLLVDYRMPIMDGLQFLAQARQIQSGVHSIILTNYPDPHLVQRATRDYGVSLVLAKPFNLSMFVGAVAFFLEQLPPVPTPSPKR